MMGDKTDLILYNANVLTLDLESPRAELVAIKDGRIARVGDNTERRGLKGRGVDCQGKTMLPGFNDAHCHVLALASSLVGVDCSPSAVASIGDIKYLIRNRAQRTPTGEWIRAAGYNEFYLAEKRHPTRADLDEAAPHHPIKLMHQSRHACVLNSLALSLAGISMETLEPPGGMIDRYLDSGEPSGILFEMDAHIDRVIPPLERSELEHGIRMADDIYLSNGITSLQDATATNGLAQWELLKDLKQRGYVTPRLSVMLGIESLEILIDSGFSPRYGDDDVRMGAMKIVLSQARGSIDPGQDVLHDRSIAAHRAGYQVAMHTVEEATVGAAISVLEQMPGEGRRHRIEHCSECPRSLLERLGEARALVVTQPSFIYYNGDRYLGTVPPERDQWLYRGRSFIGKGIVTAAGSDSPVVPVNPLAGIYAAVTRRTRGGNELASGEGISPIEALEMYTTSAAHAAFDEGVKGSIAVGKLADLILLSADPTQITPSELKDIRVEMTVVGGEIVWQA